MSALHVPLQVGDRVTLTGTVEDVGSVAAVRIDGAGHRPYSFPTKALTVPPWPGAVLSGLTDEDGVPTWLAQAGRVRGEQVRGVRSGPWGRNVYGDTVWVEVRAPRAVPVPETERVNVLDAIRNRIELTHPEGEFLAVGVELREDGDLVAIEQQEPWGKAQPVDPDGTVEVLVEAGQ